MVDNRRVPIFPSNAPESGTTWDDMFSRRAQAKDAAINQGNHSSLSPDIYAPDC